METLLAPLNFFVWHPERMVVVAAVFTVLATGLSIARGRLVWSPLVTAVSWLAFAWWESYCKANGHNIRVDLFVIWPVMFSLTLYGILAPWRKDKLQPSL